MPEYYELPYDYDIGVAPQVNFPRPLYPPDHPDGPSPDGPDAKAYKIIAWYFGRWATTGGIPNPSPSFDDSYSRAFANGSSADVGDSGIEGIQRQANIAGANGVIGMRTFNVLIYARIPEGLPNSGKFPLSINSYARELLEQAYQNFGEEDTEEKPPPVSNPRQAALNHMEARVGYTEAPPGSNFDNRSDGIHKAQDVTASGAHWLDRTYWCGEWCCYAMSTAGVKNIGSFLASVALIENTARRGDRCFKGWTTSRSLVKPGDLVVVGGYGVHVEMVRAKPLPDGGVPTYGGNTSSGISGSQSNGGGAFRRVRYPSEVRGFALVRYPGE
jgi:hypothetical protein